VVPAAVALLLLLLLLPQLPVDLEARSSSCGSNACSRRRCCKACVYVLHAENISFVSIIIIAAAAFTAALAIMIQLICSCSCIRHTSSCCRLSSCSSFITCS
jgi:hypothetical protein